MLFNQILTLLITFLPYLALAEETVSAAAHGNAWRYGTGGGIIGFVVLVLDILVFIEVLKSDRDAFGKVAWCLVVFLFPIVGMIIYWLFSNRASHNRGSGYENIA